MKKFIQSKYKIKLQLQKKKRHKNEKRKTSTIWPQNCHHSHVYEPESSSLSACGSAPKTGGAALGGALSSTSGKSRWFRHWNVRWPKPPHLRHEPRTVSSSPLACSTRCANARCCAARSIAGAIVPALASPPPPPPEIASVGQVRKK